MLAVRDDQRSVSAAKPKTVRHSLSEIIVEELDPEFIRELLHDIKEMRKGYYVDAQCPNCGSNKRGRVELPDRAGQVKELISLLEQAEGKPGTAAAGEAGLVLNVQRIWPEPEEVIPSLDARVADSGAV